MPLSKNYLSFTNAIKLAYSKFCDCLFVSPNMVKLLLSQGFTFFFLAIHSSPSFCRLNSRPKNHPSFLNLKPLGNLADASFPIGKSIKISSLSKIKSTNFSFLSKKQLGIV